MKPRSAGGARGNPIFDPALAAQDAKKGRKRVRRNATTVRTQPILNFVPSQTMTRNGKIARLPEYIRNEINQRLLDGERAVSSFGSMACRTSRL